jgi:hypothetical protein
MLERRGWRVRSVEADHNFPYQIGAYKEYRYLKVWYFRWMPEPMFRWLERRLGWHLLATAEVL